MKNSTKKFLIVVTIGLLLGFNSFSQKSLKITYASDTYADSMFGGCPLSPPVYRYFNIMINTKGYSKNDTLGFEVLFGDGTYQTKLHKDTLFSNDGMYFYHTYLKSGTFDVTYIVFDHYGNADTVIHTAEVIITQTCSSLYIYTFVDKNSNCIYDAKDVILDVPYKLYNGTSIYFEGYTPYQIDIPNNINYTAVIDTAAIRKKGYVLTCPVSGIINFTATGNNKLYFAVNCTGIYDLSVTSSGNPFKVGNSTLINVGVNVALSCTAKTGTYTLNLDPRMSYVYALHPPTSGSGQTYTWDYSNLGGLGSGTHSISNMMYCNFDASVKLGDTLCYSFSVSPTSGDNDTLNNIVNLCYKVKSAWDPNYMDVYPKGKGDIGAIPANTQLTYTVGFQNTGNDYAEHVYILDTLKNNLDLNSLQILCSSHPMQLYIINGKILKFDFVNIHLPDSGTNLLSSHGFVSYKINQTADLPAGTQLKNKAGIYFDTNPAVITNETLNTIEQIVSVSKVTKENDMFSIMPNPAKDNIIIENKNNVLQSYIVSIKNIQGQEVLNEKINFTTSQSINVRGLNNGVYILTLQNEKVNYVSRVVIQK